MKIEYRTGDMFTTEHKLIMHGCNSKGVMGSGVAKQVKTLFPEAYEQYYIWTTKGFRLGDYLAVECNGKTIINAVTQQNYGKVSVQHGPTPIRYVSYDAVAGICEKLNKDYAGQTIVMPIIGCDLGGGKWEIVSSIIEAEFTNVQPVVYTLGKV